ncbi:hypothetical protein QIS74_03255 [Colletotrichum tabaci]|uniref:Uncharacterized protein n=1 Tax=Colletotrichum tabaci TaxID=1209068 RepID=A0AAV9TS77_9PEZI
MDFSKPQNAPLTKRLEHSLPSSPTQGFPVGQVLRVRGRWHAPAGSYPKQQQQEAK